MPTALPLARRSAKHRADRSSLRGADVTDYDYDADGRLETVTYENGVAAAIYDYDDADRLVEILHQDAEQNLLLQITYAYLDDNTVDYRTEYDVIRGSLATVDFIIQSTV